MVSEINLFFVLNLFSYKKKLKFLIFLCYKIKKNIKIII